MDRQKYLSPKFSESLEPISNHIKFNCDSETNSTLTSNFSVFKVTGDLNSLAVMNQTSRGSNGDLQEIAEKLSDQMDSPPKNANGKPQSILKEPRNSSLSKLQER